MYHRLAATEPVELDEDTINRRRDQKRRYQQEGAFRQYLKASKRAALSKRRGSTFEPCSNYLWLSRPTKASVARQRAKHDVGSTTARTSTSGRGDETARSGASAAFKWHPRGVDDGDDDSSVTSFIGTSSAVRATQDFLEQMEGQVALTRESINPFGGRSTPKVRHGSGRPKPRDESSAAAESGHLFPDAIGRGGTEVLKAYKSYMRLTGNAAGGDGTVGGTASGSRDRHSTSSPHRELSLREFKQRRKRKGGPSSPPVRQLQPASPGTSLPSLPQASSTPTRRFRQLPSPIQAPPGSSQSRRGGAAEPGASQAKMSPRTRSSRRAMTFNAIRGRDDRIPFTALASLDPSASPSARSSALAERNRRKGIEHGIRTNPSLRSLPSPGRSPIGSTPPRGALERYGSRRNLSTPISLEGGRGGRRKRRTGEKLAKQVVKRRVQAAADAGLLPEPMALGIVRKGRHVLNLSDYRIGDKVAGVMARSEFEEALIDVNLSSNRLTGKGAAALLSRVQPQELCKLNLSHNILRLVGAKAVASLLRRAPRLRVLNLEHTELGDAGTQVVAAAASSSPSLRCLVLARNGISHAGSHALAALLAPKATARIPTRLRQLDLSWNDIRGEGALSVFRAMQTNNTVLALDMSWNGLGRAAASGASTVEDHEPPVLQMLGNMFRHNSTLRHLDLGHNNIAAEHVPGLARSLKRNHTLQGIHCDGNGMRVNARGFLVPCKHGWNDHDAAASPPGGRLLFRDGLYGDLVAPHRRRRRPYVIAADMANRDNCWLCGGWKPFCFEYQPAARAVPKRVSLCSSFDEWVARDPLEPPPEDEDGRTCFRLWRMVPPSDAEYSFSIDGGPPTPLDDRPSHVALSDTSVQPTEEGGVVAGVRPRVHYIKSSSLPKAFVVEDDLPVWRFEDSLFASFKFDTDERVRRCLELDWSRTKVPKFVKNEEDQRACLELLGTHYRVLMRLFRQACSSDHTTFFLSLNAFSEWCQRCDIPDSEFCKGPDLDTIFIATNVQFPEMLLRIAGAKYVKSERCETYRDALERLLEEHVLPYALDDPLGSDDAFRHPQLHTEEVDTTFRNHVEDLEQVYIKYAGRTQVLKPGERPLVSLGDLCLMLAEAGLSHDDAAGGGGGATKTTTAAQYVLSGARSSARDPGGVSHYPTRHDLGTRRHQDPDAPKFNERTIKVAFAHSVMTVEDVLAGHRQQLLCFLPEFLEVLARLAMHDNMSRRVPLAGKVDRLVKALIQVLMFNPVASADADLGDSTEDRSGDGEPRSAQHVTPREDHNAGGTGRGTPSLVRAGSRMSLASTMSAFVAAADEYDETDDLARYHVGSPPEL